MKKSLNKSKKNNNKLKATKPKKTKNMLDAVDRNKTKLRDSLYTDNYKLSYL